MVNRSGISNRKVLYVSLREAQDVPILPTPFGEKAILPAALPEKVSNIVISKTSIAKRAFIFDGPPLKKQDF
jgi:hypothetical protein